MSTVKKRRRVLPASEKRPQAPSLTEEGREKQLIALALALAEKQIRAGTASSQVVTHFLKMGSTSQALEKAKLEQENLLLQAKTEALKSGKRVEEMYKDALEALGIYQGRP